MPDIEGLQHWPGRSGPIPSSTDVMPLASGVTVQSGYPAHTKGAWVELIASTSKKAIGIAASFSCIENPYRYLADVGIGAAGSETVLIPNIYLNIVGITCVGTTMIFLPCSLPAGTRLSMRFQFTGASYKYGYGAVDLITQD